MTQTEPNEASPEGGSLPKKAIFLLVDALRYDVLANLDAAKAIAPNMARIAERGIIRKCVTNAQSTQFVLPSLFTQTYPLDYGGYNNGIRERPQSFVESLKSAGFETHLMSSSNQIGVTLGFDRGFDTIRTTTDYRTLLEQRISRTLTYEIKLWRDGERPEAETIAIIQKELGLLLDVLETGIREHDKSLWPAALHRINDRVSNGCAAERRLLKEEPLLIIAKLERIPASVYWQFLGSRTISPVKLFLARAKAGFAWRLHRWAAHRWWFPFMLVGHFQVKSGEVISGITNFIRENRDKSWYVHMHAMDAHDCRCLNRPLHMLYRLTYLPRWWHARLTGKTKRRWTYDTSIMYVDDCLGELFDTLEKTGQLESTSILITGDHGFDYASSPRGRKHVAIRNYREDIEVPMVLVCDFETRQNAGEIVDNGMLDSMGLCASFLDALNVPQHQSFKGKSVFRGGRKSVISENAGSGNADIERRDLYFTVTTEDHKLMTVLVGSELQLLHLYDLQNDPDELNDLLGQDKYEELVHPLVSTLMQERGEIFQLRNAATGLSHQEWRLAS